MCGTRLILHVLGTVAIIVYGWLLLCNSLFQEVLKRSGTFEKSKKFFKIRQIRVLYKIYNIMYVKISGSRIRYVYSRSRSGCRMPPCMHRALMRYCRTVYSCTRPEVVNIWHVCTLCVHCVYTVCTLCTPVAAAVSYIIRIMRMSYVFFCVRYCRVG
jgi:predicted HAD superfamily hydrolase